MYSPSFSGLCCSDCFTILSVYCYCTAKVCRHLNDVMAQHNAYLEKLDHSNHLLIMYERIARALAIITDFDKCDEFHELYEFHN